MTIKRTREIEIYTDNGKRWPIYEYVDTETGEVIYRRLAGRPVKKLSETGFRYPGAKKRVVRVRE